MNKFSAADAISYLNDIHLSLLSGNLYPLNTENIIIVSEMAVDLLNKPMLSQDDKKAIEIIIAISQIVYNNTDKDILFLDDGVYDLLLEKNRTFNNNFQVGAPVIKFDQNGEAILEERPLINPILFLEDGFKDNSLFFNELNNPEPSGYRHLYMNQVTDRNSGRILSKKNVNVPHKYPKLVGSLDKCKFVLNKEAIDRGVFDDDKVKIFERDFLQKHLQMGLIDMTTPFEMVAELKYDGVSVEADVTHEILSARSRGDANADIAADLTEVLGGYKFPYAVEIPEEESFGMKFEAIITYMNLSYMSQIKGKGYKNSRNGIIGLLGSSDAYDYRDLITLIPLATSIENIDRITEIEFLNKYYNSGELLRYAVLRGTYTEILYQVYKFVQDAEGMRSILPFMYDGVVISYTDPKIINALGRENSINKYSMAIKFNPLVRQAVFNGYSYTVGQMGTITPMIHYTPVEFYGTIHTKSSGHSYKRFTELNLSIGDILQVEYTNDVMPYVSKPAQDPNPNPPEQFPTHCPFCGSEIVFADSFKSAFCPNKQCPERIVSKMANMMSKMNLKDFGEETFRFLGTKSLSHLMSYTYEDVKALGPVTADKLLARINEIKMTPIYDYKIMGAIGFSGIAIETWRKILNQMSIQEIISLSDQDLMLKLISIKGIGEKTAAIIVSERYDLSEDINCILSLPNIIPSFGIKTGKIIRYTGCRPDDQLTAYLESKGCDARGDAGVTKATDILVVPYEGFTSSKVSKVGPNTIIVDMARFRSEVDKFIL